MLANTSSMKVFPISVTIPLPNPPKEKTRLERIAYIHCRNHLGINIPALRWHMFETFPKHYRKVVLPAFITSETSEPFVVACFQITQSPYSVTILGICEPSTGRIREDIPSWVSTEISLNKVPIEEKEESTTTTTIPISMIPTTDSSIDSNAYLPTFFVFKGMPNFPEMTTESEMSSACYRLWNWLTYSYKKLNHLYKIEEDTEQQVAFYLLIVACLNDMQPLLAVYSSYLKVQFSSFSNSAIKNSFIQKYGIQINGFEEIEEKLVTIVRIEAGILIDNKHMWEPKIPASLATTLTIIRNWIQESKKKRGFEEMNK